MADDFPVKATQLDEGVGDSPVKPSHLEYLGTGSISGWPCPPISLSIPGLDTGGGAAAVSPAISGSRGVATPSPAKEGMLRVSRPVSSIGAMDDGDISESPAPSPHPGRTCMVFALTIDPGGECMPTELEKKKAKLDKYRLECSEVADSFLYVSGEDAARQQDLINSKGITHIINCAGPQCPNYLEYTGRFNFLRLNFYDHRTEDVAWFMYSAFDFIKEAQAQRGRVLVHCVQGVSRSCTLAIAWLMLTTGIDYDEAYLRVRKGRPICAPNTGFICSLLEWQRRKQQQPVLSPLLYRTAWHVPLFPNDLVLKLCLHEDDRKNVPPTLAALDTRACYLIVVPRPPRRWRQKSEPPTVPTAPKRGQEGDISLEANGTAKSRLTAPSTSDPAHRSDSRPSLTVLTASSAASRAAAAAAAAVAANAKAVLAIAAAKEARAVAEEAAARAIEAGVTIPWSWEEAPEFLPTMPPTIEIVEAPKRTVLPPTPEVKFASDIWATTPEVDVKTAVTEIMVPALAVAEMGEEDEEEGGVDVYVWKGSQSSSQMLELARKGAGWLHEYEGWGAGTSAWMVEEGREPAEMLRHLEPSGGGDVREPPVYGDLSSPSPPPTAARISSGSAFLPCATPSLNAIGSRAPILSPAEAPPLSPAGPSPSPGGVSFSPYGCGVSPASVLFGCPTVSPPGSAAVSPATTYRGQSNGGAPDRDIFMNRRCSLTSATEMEEEDEEEGGVMMGLPMAIGGGDRHRASQGGYDVGNKAGGGRPHPRAVPQLFELSDELGGQGASGLRWSPVTVFDDQDLLPPCCFLLVAPEGKNFLWIGNAFAENFAQEAGNLQQVLLLARDVAVLDARRGSSRRIPGASDVEAAVIVTGDGEEPPEWWSTFESGYS